MNEKIKLKVIERFKSRQFLFKTMHIKEIYLAFISNNTLDIVIEMEDGFEFNQEKDTLVVFVASVLGLHDDFTFYLIEMNTYTEKERLFKIE